MSISEDRKAENEAAFRDANERIRYVQRELSPPVERATYPGAAARVAVELDPRTDR